MTDFDLVYDSIFDARGIAFDGCHKIYILKDEAQVQLMREYEYELLFTDQELSEQEMYDTVRAWYEDSCMLRFIEAVSTVEGDPNEGFEVLIAQGENNVFG